MCFSGKLSDYEFFPISIVSVMVSVFDCSEKENNLLYTIKKKS